MKNESVILTDLGKLAVDRCRAAFMSVGQLIEDDMERAAVLIAVATDMVRGAASMIDESDETLSENEAVTVAIGHLLIGLDVESIQVGARKLSERKGLKS